MYDEQGREGLGFLFQGDCGGKEVLVFEMEKYKMPRKIFCFWGLGDNIAHFLAKTCPCNPAPEDDQYLDSYGALTLLADHCCY